MNNIKNIIYFLPAAKSPSGGAKSIYKHSDTINKLLINGITSSIIHYKKKKIAKYSLSFKKFFLHSDIDKNFGYDANEIEVVKNFKPTREWSSIKIKHKNDFKFNSETDLVIFPEIIAHFAKKFCLNKKIKYSIFVLGAYHMHQTNNLKILDEVYKKSSFLMDISNNTRKCLLDLLPNYKKKIFRINLSVDSNLFKISKIKKNLITCMPRKLKEDFHLLKFFISKKIPKNWNLIVLNNMTNKQIAKKLSLSKIFLSFSSFEGLGLPPIEAAFAGNKVIGYTGEAGNDYFKSPIFEKVYKGDVLDFSRKIEKNINNLNKNWHLQNSTSKRRKLLVKKYSIKNEIKSLKIILSYIITL